MGALTETSALITEFSGDYKVAVFLIDGAATGTVTVDEFSSIAGAFTTLAEDSTADNCGYSVTVATNVVTCKGIEGDGTVNTQNAIDFYLVVIGK